MPRHPEVLLKRLWKTLLKSWNRSVQCGNYWTYLFGLQWNLMDSLCMPTIQTFHQFNLVVNLKLLEICYAIKSRNRPKQACRFYLIFSLLVILHFSILFVYIYRFACLSGLSNTTELSCTSSLPKRLSKLSRHRIPDCKWISLSRCLSIPIPIPVPVPATPSWASIFSSDPECSVLSK